jgi:hypothetical protein
MFFCIYNLLKIVPIADFGKLTGLLGIHRIYFKGTVYRGIFDHHDFSRLSLW